MEFKYHKYEVADNILTLTLNTPDKLNAVNAASCKELIAAFDAADLDDDVGAVIVTGAGRAFCAGADLSDNDNQDTFYDRFTGKADTTPRRDDGGVVCLRIYDMKKPVIAAINGAAVGFGSTLTLPMDIRIASKKARMGFVFARRGIILDGAATWFLPRLVGMSAAAEWVYSGRIFNAQEALDRRLVSELLEPDELLPRARQIAREIVDNSSSISVALCRQLMWKMLGADHPMEAHILESKILNWTYGAGDSHEGVKSFLEKRPPAFPMKVTKDMPGFYPWWKPREFRP
jgi:enoyl-CoA hydratase/carnithine racemase